MACLDVTSPAVQFGSEDAVASGTVDEQQNRTLSFNLDITFLPGQEYYILIDAGIIITRHTKFAAGPRSRMRNFCSMMIN